MTTTSTIVVGDAIESLRAMPDASVHCCVTSPPYWGLRDYGTATWEGGDPTCDHLGPPMRTKATINTNCGTGEDRKNTEGREFFRSQCRRCGAVRVDQQIGLEETPDAYVSRLVEVFREVRRVLRDDGTLWLNLGDSYAGARGQSLRGGPPSESSTLEGNGHRGGGPKIKSMMTVSRRRDDAPIPRSDVRVQGLKPKDLVGIPWRVAFALQADGWWLRSDIIWAKANPMPESVIDRPTKAHEYVFLLTKSDRYFYNADAIRETHAPSSLTHRGGGRMGGHEEHQDALGKVASGGWGRSGGVRRPDPRGANARTVWTIPSHPFAEAHFATMPPALAKRCVLAGCPAGGTVLDPFSGAGTTGLVAVENGCSFVGVELNPEYAEMARRRIAPALAQGKLFS